MMPVGAYTKEEIRSMAADIGLPVAAKKDSQEICFVPDKDYASFIERETGKTVPEGNFVNTKGEIIGRHRGITHYTVGQRRGLQIAAGRRIFVLEIRPETNEVVIGEGDEVFSHTVKANRLNFMGLEEFPIGTSVELTGKIRYGHKGAACTVTRTGEDELVCQFPEAVRAVTPGQALVLYKDGYVAAGGTIIR